MIDPNDDLELQQMEKMGLPVVFINCRADVSIYVVELRTIIGVARLYAMPGHWAGKPFSHATHTHAHLHNGHQYSIIKMYYAFLHNTLPTLLYVR